MQGFVSQYAQDFNRLDVQGIADWYEFPTMMVTPQANLVYSTRKELVAGLTALLDRYRAAEFARAVVLDERIVEGRHGLSQTDVEWRLLNSADTRIMDFEISYTHKDVGDRAKICCVVSHNELQQWANRATAT